MKVDVEGYEYPTLLSASQYRYSTGALSGLAFTQIYTSSNKTSTGFFQRLQLHPSSHLTSPSLPSSLLGIFSDCVYGHYRSRYQRSDNNIASNIYLIYLTASHRISTLLIKIDVSKPVVFSWLSILLTTLRYRSFRFPFPELHSNGIPFLRIVYRSVCHAYDIL